MAMCDCDGFCICKPRLLRYNVNGGIAIPDPADESPFHFPKLDWTTEPRVRVWKRPPRLKRRPGFWGLEYITVEWLGKITTKSDLYNWRGAVSILLNVVLFPFTFMLLCLVPVMQFVDYLFSEIILNLKSEDLLLFANGLILFYQLPLAPFLVYFFMLCMIPVNKWLWSSNTAKSEVWAFNFVDEYCGRKVANFIGKSIPFGFCHCTWRDEITVELLLRLHGIGKTLETPKSSDVFSYFIKREHKGRVHAVLLKGVFDRDQKGETQCTITSIRGYLTNLRDNSLNMKGQEHETVSCKGSAHQFLKLKTYFCHFMRMNGITATVVDDLDRNKFHSLHSMELKALVKEIMVGDLRVWKLQMPRQVMGEEIPVG